jgi:hypothetical protein
VIGIFAGSDAASLGVRDKNSITGICSDSANLPRVAAMPGAYGNLRVPGTNAATAEIVGGSVFVFGSSTFTTSFVIIPISSDLAVQAFLSASGNFSIDANGLQTTPGSAGALTQFGFGYLRRMNRAVPNCEQLGSSTAFNGTATVVIDGVATTPGAQLNAALDAQTASSPGLFPSVTLLPNTCTTRNRDFTPGASGSFVWSNCGARMIDSLVTQPFGLSIYSVLPAKIPYDITGAAVPLSRGCYVTGPSSSDSLTNTDSGRRLTVVVNGVVYSAAADGDAGDSVSFNLPMGTSPITIRLFEPARPGVLGTTITLQSEPFGVALQSVRVERGGVTVGCTDPRASF